MSELPVLWQFTASHYNEKARWALDWKGLPYRRRSLLPGLHVPTIFWMTGQKSVPVLTIDGLTIADSTRIIETLEMRKPDPPLFPADPVARRRALELEDFFDRELGPHLRRAVFDAVLGDSDYACALFTQDAKPLARRAYRTMFPAVRLVMKIDLGIDDERAALSRDRVARAFDRLESELQPSGYLVGDRFTVADLTAAALAAPLVQPPEFPYAWPPSPPDAAVRLRADYVDRPGFRWVQEMYRRHRGRSLAEVRAA
ncbi:MAG TPA: glutathione S-transferase [Candidatus Binatia bacterium]|nr:glutathione S-transferase [Candidatus Binatia bacterium]